MKKSISIILLLIFSLQIYAQNIKKLGYNFDTKTFNFGNVEQWHNQPAIFTFTNNTKHQVTILPLFNENDLEVIFPDRPIEIGESVVIKAKYYTAGKGLVNRKFSIYFGSLAEPVYLRVMANIKSLSPDAYKQCPMAKPEMAMQRIELIGDIAEIDTEMPLNGSLIEIIGLNTKKNVTIYSNSKGKFNTKLPVGNYQIKVSHPDYYSYNGPFYIGQTSPPLRIRLTPVNENPVFAHKNITVTEDKILEKTIVKKEIETIDEPVFKEHKIVKANEPKVIVAKPVVEKVIKKELEDIPEIPITLTTYKENIPDDVKEEKVLVSKKIEKELKPKQTSTYKEETKELTEKPIVTETVKKETIIKEKPAKIEKERPIKVQKEKVQKIEVVTNNYIFKVIDKNTNDAISNSAVSISDVYNKGNKHKGKTDKRGYLEMEIPKEEYKFIASADGYISNEIRILKNDKSTIFRIELDPISNLYDDIYETKKDQQQDNKEVLDKLSFGKTDFTFAKDEDEKVPIKDEAIVAYTAEKELATIEKELALERKEKKAEDSLELLIAKLTIENKEKEQSLEKIKLEELEKNNKAKELEKLDSLNTYINELISQNNSLENDLEKVKKEKVDLSDKNTRAKEKMEELEASMTVKEEEKDLSILSKTKYAANNILFLIDISTSMGKAQKIEMLQKSIKNLTSVLRDIDRVAIITYNQKSSVVLESVNGDSKSKIISAIDSLKTGGLTNGVRGITAAYEMLEYYYIPEGNNQIILATDGLFSKYNNEMTEYELNRLVKKQANKNMNLTVVGFGKNEEGKDLMTKLAKNGNGQYIQIKNDWMTKDVLIKEIQLNSKK